MQYRDIEGAAPKKEFKRVHGTDNYSDVTKKKNRFLSKEIK